MEGDMNYQIWTKDEYTDNWTRKDAGDLGAAKRLLLEELKKGGDPILTTEVPFDLVLKLGEPGAETKRKPVKKETATDEKAEEETPSEVDQDKTEPD